MSADAAYGHPGVISPKDSPKESHDIEEGEDSGFVQVSAVHPALRTAFLRRVYGILTAQMALTVAVCLLCSLNEGARQFSVSYAGPIMCGTTIPLIGVLVGLFVWKNSYPANVVLLSIFTGLQAWTLGVVCGMFYEAGAGKVLLQAAGLTLVVFFALTGYALTTKADFSFLTGFLTAGLFLMIGWGLMNLVIGFRTSLLYSLCGALLFCGFILFDTYLISQRYSLDDYIIAAIELYLDIVNLFLYILQMLSQRDN